MNDLQYTCFQEHNFETLEILWGFEIIEKCLKNFRWNTDLVLKYWSGSENNKENQSSK